MFVFFDVLQLQYINYQSSITRTEDIVTSCYHDTIPIDYVKNLTPRPLLSADLSIALLSLSLFLLQVHETHFLLPFITKIGSHFGDYLRKVLGCQAEHRTYIAQPRSSRLSAPSVDPVHSISSSSSNEQPQPHPSFIFERSNPQSPRIPLLPPPKHIQKPLSQGARAPIYSRPQHIQPIEHYDETTSESFPKLSVSPSRPIQRSFHVDNPSSPGFEDIPNPDGTSSITQSSRSDSSVPQPFEELLFSPPPVDMSGLPPPVFAGSDSSTSALPDIVQAISVSSG